MPEPEEREEEAGDEAAPYSPLVEALLEPISDDAPCGTEVRYDDDFMALKNQINLIGSVTGEADYDEIVELGEKILKDKSKDLTTVTYLALGLTRTKGLAGMAEGIVATHALVERFWEDVHPSKPVRRRNALQFLADHLKEWIQHHSGKPTEADREPLEVAQNTLQELQSFTMEALEDKAPALSGLASELKRLIRKLPDPEPEPDAEGEGEASPGDGEGRAPAARAAVPGEIDSASDAGSVVLKAARFLREEKLANAIPYRLVRTVRWGMLVNVPPSENGTTRIEPPLEQRRTYLKGLLEKGDYQTLVEEAEASFQQNPFHFWLDLQRFTVASLDALGKPYEDARDAVLQEAAFLMHRLPGLASLTFSDGTPFADPLTVDWLENEVAAAGGGGGAAGGRGASEQQDALEEQYQAARKMLGGGDLSGALEELQNGAASDGSKEQAFRRRLYAAELCLKGDRSEVARPLLERLDDDVERHALAEWNPRLALTVWSDLYTCYNVMLRQANEAEKQDYAQRAEQTFEKISRLDAGYALKVLGTR